MYIYIMSNVESTPGSLEGDPLQEGYCPGSPLGG